MTAIFDRPDVVAAEDAAHRAGLAATARLRDLELADRLEQERTRPVPEWFRQGAEGPTAQWTRHAPTVKRLRTVARNAALRRGKATAAAWLAAIAARTRLAVAPAERARLEDSYPLTDADTVAVAALVSGRLPWATHAPGNPLSSARGANTDAETVRLWETRMGERWLAVHILHRQYGASEIATRLGVTERTVLRWLNRPAFGWPLEDHAGALPSDLTPHHQRTSPVA